MKPAYKEKYPHLFEPLKVEHGKTPFKNRILLAPLGYQEQFNVDDGHYNTLGIEYWTSFVRGGLASVTVPLGFSAREGTGFDGNGFNLDPKAYNHSKARLIQRAVHAYQGKTFIEIYHTGRCAAAVANEDIPVLAASDGEYQGHHVKGMDEADMEFAVNQYSYFARLAKRSGFDGIQLHFAHGWLVHDFLSPLSNKRTDEYGGSVENRCRFPQRVVKAVRDAVGDDMIIELRIDGSDMVEGGITPEDAAQQLLILQEYADMAHVTCGTRLDMTTRAMMVPTYYLETEHNVWAAEIIRNTPGIRIPVGVVGSISSPGAAEEIIASGKADYVLIGRSAIADPEYVNKIIEDREEDIRPCLRCSYCLDHGRRKALFKKRELAIVKETTFDGGCAVNPLSHQGCVKLLFPGPDRVKRVSVIGGGIAGMNAALAAADRGHQVKLYESSGHLGGQAAITDGMWFKKEQKAYHEWLARQVKKHPNIDLQLGVRATPEKISQEDPDAAIVAVGGAMKIPDIPGLKNAKFYFDAFHDHERFGHKVVVVGSGVGSELAIYLAENGHECTVIDKEEFIAPNIDLTVRVSLLATLEKNHIEQLTETEAVEVTENGVIVHNPLKGRYLIQADDVIIAAGTKPQEKLRDRFRDVARTVIPVGDAMGDGNLSIAHAVETGFDAGYTL